MEDLIITVNGCDKPAIPFLNGLLGIPTQESDGPIFGSLADKVQTVANRKSAFDNRKRDQWDGFFIAIDRHPLDDAIAEAVKSYIKILEWIIVASNPPKELMAVWAQARKLIQESEARYKIS